VYTLYNLLRTAVYTAN